MKILIDIGHPAHVHYFRNFIKIMEQKGHSFLVTAREKDVTLGLLDKFGIKYINRGKGYKGLIRKAFYMLKADFLIYKLAKKFNPDIFLSFSSPYAAQVAKLMNIPHIAYNDTEAATLGILSFLPFTKVVITPRCYSKDLGKKQLRFNGLMELTYLHPSYYTPDNSIFEILSIKKDEPYSIVRFVSWEASHDIGEQGISDNFKKKIINELSKHSRVFITSEAELTSEFKQYQISIPPDKMHDALAYAVIYIGESPTMTTESALLGTPSICVSSWACDCGNFQDLKKYDMIYCYRPQEENKIFDKITSLITAKNIKKSGD